MALSPIEQVALWGPPLAMLLITIGYYVRWGKETDEKPAQSSSVSSGGNR